MVKGAFVVAASLMATPAFAAPLWQGVEAGMTSKQVMKLFPKADRSSKKIKIKKFEPINGCDSDVDVILDDGFVTEVVVSGDDSKCAQKLQMALLDKYGEPQAANQSAGSQNSGGLKGLVGSQIRGQVGGQLEGQLGSQLRGLGMGQSVPGMGLATSMVGRMFGGRSRSSQDTVWFNEGVMLRYEMNGDKWSMTYSPIGELGL